MKLKHRQSVSITVKSGDTYKVYSESTGAKNRRVTSEFGPFDSYDQAATYAAVLDFGDKEDKIDSPIRKIYTRRSYQQYSK